VLSLFSRLSGLFLFADRFDRAGRSACEASDADVFVANGFALVIEFKSACRACSHTSTASNAKFSVDCNWHVSLSSLFLHADYNIAGKAVQSFAIKQFYVRGCGILSKRCLCRYNISDRKQRRTRYEI
jgi:hypothetical protein